MPELDLPEISKEILSDNQKLISFAIDLQGIYGKNSNVPRKKPDIIFLEDTPTGKEKEWRKELIALHRNVLKTYLDYLKDPPSDLPKFEILVNQSLRRCQYVINTFGPQYPNLNLIELIWLDSVLMLINIYLPAEETEAKFSKLKESLGMFNKYIEQCIKYLEDLRDHRLIAGKY